MYMFVEKTHQTYENAEELDDICVRHRVQSPNQCVEDGNQGWNHHWHVDVDVYDHAQCCTCAEDSEGFILCLDSTDLLIYNTCLRSLTCVKCSVFHTQGWQNGGWPEDLSQ